jgi:predicted RNase H-like HicB family nuclease
VVGVKRYRVTYERDPAGWWVASVRDIAGCHTQGRTLAQARRRIREALGLFVANTGSAELVDEVRLPAQVRRALVRSHSARANADIQKAKAAETMSEAVRVLTGDFRLSVRDAAELLGLSHQRVQQLLARRQVATGIR